MLQTDFSQFCATLDDVWAFYPQAKQPTVGQKALFFRTLRDMSLADATGAFDAHMRDPVRGRFPPLPADLVYQVGAAVADDGRPDVEEAWAKAIRSADEFETVVWTTEMAQAWAEVASLFSMGDKVGARMAFKDVYARLIADARAARRAPEWTAALGYDTGRRALALAAAAHLLEPHKDKPLIEAREHLLLEAPEGQKRDPIEALAWVAPEEFRERLLAARERLVGACAIESRDAAGKRRTDRLRQDAADMASAAGVDAVVLRPVMSLQEIEQTQAKATAR